MRTKNPIFNEEITGIQSSVIYCDKQNSRMLQSFGAVEENCHLSLPYALPGLVMQGVETCEVVHAADAELNGNIWNNWNNNIKDTPITRLRESATQVLEKPYIVPFDAANGKNSATVFNLPAVSTGLCLSLENAKSLNSNTDMDLNWFSIPNARTANILPSPFAHRLALETQRYRSDIQELVKLESERLNEVLKESGARHTRTVVCTAVEIVSRIMREKDLQLMTMKRRNMELEGHIKSLLMELQAWQSRAKSSEAVARSLKMKIDEKSKEGSGDSEEDMMVNTDENNIGSVNIYLGKCELSIQGEGRCRLCRINDVSILLWPCRHLCLCNACQSKVEFCPVCALSITQKIQVYLS